MSFWVAKNVCLRMTKKAFLRYEATFIPHCTKCLTQTSQLSLSYAQSMAPFKCPRTPTSQCRPFTSHLPAGKLVAGGIIMTKHAAAFALLFPVFFAITKASTFTITNGCPYAIWPGILAGAGSPDISPTGFRLEEGASYTVIASPAWSGRIWARTGCDFDGEGNGVCQTGDCGIGLECKGHGAQPPATLFEITLGNGEAKDYYDVSLVDGYNLPMIVVPQGLDGGCNITGCTTDLNSGCPKELQVVDGDVVACRSACDAFGLDQYCCSGSFASPTLCSPSYYSTIFKSACPKAYSYAFDDGTSTFTCKAVAYTITFLPSA